MKKIPSSEITPEHIYLNRRKFMVGAGSVAGALALAACVSPGGSSGGEVLSEPAALPADITGDLPSALAYDTPTASSTTDELGDSLNTYEEITNYNNFYEFTTDK